MMAIFLHLSMQHRSHVLDIDLNPKIYSQFGFLLTDHWEYLPEKLEGKLNNQNYCLGHDNSNWGGGEREEGKKECLLIFFPKIKLQWEVGYSSHKVR